MQPLSVFDLQVDSESFLTIGLSLRHTLQRCRVIEWLQFSIQSLMQFLDCCGFGGSSCQFSIESAVNFEFQLPMRTAHQSWCFDVDPVEICNNTCQPNRELLWEYKLTSDLDG